MDSLLTAAARALAAGDLFGALNRVALRDDAPALALRGVVMARMGDLERARELLRRAARRFGTRESLAGARCVLAEAEIALAMRDLGFPPAALERAGATLLRHADRSNAAHARLLVVRRLLLLGSLSEAESMIEDIDHRVLSPPLRAVFYLVQAGIAMRRLQVARARDSLRRASAAARASAIVALAVEVDSARRALKAPAARVISKGSERLMRFEQMEGILHSPALVVDACRFAVRDSHAAVSLAGRPVLMTLACALAQAWPRDMTRDLLILRAFRLRPADESHRARLRVEIGRLRRLLRPVAEIRSTPLGFRLDPRGAREVLVVAPPVEAEHGALQALLADGESWSSSALALVLKVSQRKVQRSLDALAASGKVQSLGAGRAQRWMAPLEVGVTASLLLPDP
ncbi:MAG TPA: hypothetical protein VHZ99_09595 [Steroidobacteraceae bacterium]|jgi:hypothetical protein|nr:hypothetical protein [Steroidobacteraceae bacterium]